MMKSSTDGDVRSLVRGWLQASPNIERIKLAPSPLVSTFSPRPERLGLGAVPPQDHETHVYNDQLERRIKRKISGKRRRVKNEIDYNDVAESQSEKIQGDISDDGDSRSTSIHGNKPPRPPQAMDSLLNVTLKKSRKRKRKKRESDHSFNSSSSISESLTPASEIVVEDLVETPVLQRLNGILRGGAEQTIIEQQSDSIMSSSPDGVTNSDDELESDNIKKCCTRKIQNETFTKKKKSKKRLSLRKRVSLPWSPVSHRHRQLGHWRRRQRHNQLQKKNNLVNHDET